MAYQETAAEQLERYKAMPSFARDFRNKSLEQQTEIFQEFGIKHAIHRKMFEFLCIVIQDALVRTGRSFTTYKYYADAVLKWASNPNNLRSMPGFPRSEDTLKTNFEPLLEILVQKGIVIRNSQKARAFGGRVAMNHAVGKPTRKVRIVVTSDSFTDRQKIVRCASAQT